VKIPFEFLEFSIERWLKRFERSKVFERLERLELSVTVERLERASVKGEGVRLFKRFHEEVFSFSALSGRNLYVVGFECCVVRVKDLVQHSKIGDRYG
jgi:hypothetical protein